MRGQTLALASFAALSLTACVAAPPASPAASSPAAASADTLPPAHVFIEGEWVCNTESSTSDTDDYDYVFQFRIGPDTIVMTQQAPSEPAPYLSRYSYELDGSTIMTIPEVGVGWTIELPEQPTVDAPNYARVDSGGSSNLEVTVTPDTALWSDYAGMDWSCERGAVDFEGAYTSDP